ncbi:uncharacterized protein LOC128199980 [Galleria mellonella]|uniref:Uncharacterized protein LOC128199980 n=1 Tax=Galleria mellonella TaxID=7137 RepID=A0ABM3MKR4_GALME|nr:uncharacterized protein LOC128199980 [Galleria mellonella]
MPKRKREESKEERWSRKMKKYEAKLLKTQCRNTKRIVYSSDEDDVHIEEHPVPGETELFNVGNISSEQQEIFSDLDSYQDLPPKEVPLTVTENNEEVAECIDSELLQALGENESEITEYGDEIYKDIATRFQKILIEGLRKENREELIKKYLFPKNLPFLKAPTLNPELWFKLQGPIGSTTSVRQSNQLATTSRWAQNFICESATCSRRTGATQSPSATTAAAASAAPTSLQAATSSRSVAELNTESQFSSPATWSTFLGSERVIREGFSKQGVPKAAVDVMISSLSRNTISQYNSSLRKWWEYCNQNHCDFYEVNLSSLLIFLTECFQSGSSYGTLNNHRSAISLISSNNIGHNEKIKRFFKGIFKLKPVFPRYIVTWDTNIVLNHLANLSNDSINLEMLSKKLVMLLALATGQRTQTLSLIKISNITYYNDRIVIAISDLIKTSGIGRRQPVLNLPFFNSRPSICPAATLKFYVASTSFVRPNDVDHLILTSRKPYKAVSSQTLGRWIKLTLQESGIDTSIFGAHSTRHASTSAASRAGLSVDVIRKVAGWSDQSAVFANFYNRPIIDTTSNLLIN